MDIRQLAFERQKDRYEDRLDFAGVVVDLESGKRFAVSETVTLHLTQKSHDAYSRSWYPLLRDFQLPSGRYQARVAVQDENSHRLGSVVHEFDVPELSGFRTSSPVLSDTLEPAKEGALPRPVLLARARSPRRGSCTACRGLRRCARGVGAPTSPPLRAAELRRPRAAPRRHRPCAPTRAATSSG